MEYKEKKVEKNEGKGKGGVLWRKWEGKGGVLEEREGKGREGKIHN